MVVTPTRHSSCCVTVLVPPVGGRADFVAVEEFLACLFFEEGVLNMQADEPPVELHTQLWNAFVEEARCERPDDYDVDAFPSEVLAPLPTEMQQQPDSDVENNLLPAILLDNASGEIESQAEYISLLEGLLASAGIAFAGSAPPPQQRQQQRRQQQRADQQAEFEASNVRCRHESRMLRKSLSTNPACMQWVHLSLVSRPTDPRDRCQGSHAHEAASGSARTLPPSGGGERAVA